MLSNFHVVRSIYLLVDCSESMKGKLIETIYKIIDSLISCMKQDEDMQLLSISVIIFSTDVQQIVPLTPVYEFKMPELKTGGEKSLGRALGFLRDCVNTEKWSDKKINHPIVLLFTDGKYPIDMEIFLREIRTIYSLPLYNFIVWVPLNTNIKYLNEITKHIIIDKSGEDINFQEEGAYWKVDESFPWKASEICVIKETNWRPHNIQQSGDISFSSRKSIAYPCQSVEKKIISTDKINKYNKGAFTMSNFSRRLPVYLLVDCSGSMSG